MGPSALTATAGCWVQATCPFLWARGAQSRPAALRDELTCQALLPEAVNGGPLGLGLEQEQQHGLQDASHIAQGQRPHQPALGRRADGAVCTGQAVQHDEQGPAGGECTVASAPCDTLCARSPQGASVLLGSETQADKVSREHQWGSF